MSGLFPDVGNDTVALQAKFFGELGNDREDVRSDGVVVLGDLSHGGEVGLGNDQEVGGGLGVDVVEGQADGVLLELVGGNIPGGDFAE